MGLTSSVSSTASRIWWRCWHAVTWYLLSAHFQLGLQLAAGIVLTSLPTFVSVLRFPHACFSSVLIVIGLVSMSPDGHIGTKLLAAYQLVGQAWLGAITAGLMVTIAKPVELVSREAYIAALCVTTCLGLGLLTSSRAGPAPITLWPNITISCLNFAVVVLWAQSTHPLSKVWRADVAGMCLCGLTAALAVCLVAGLVLPTVATEEVVRLTSAAVRGVGHSLSRYLSLLLDTSAAPQQPTHDQHYTAHRAAVTAAAAPAGESVHSAGSSSIVVDVRDHNTSSSKTGSPQHPAPAAATTATTDALQVDGSSGSIVFAPAHEPVQLMPLVYHNHNRRHQQQQQQQRQQQHDHRHKRLQQPQQQPTDHQGDQQLVADQHLQHSHHQQQPQQHHHDAGGHHLHRGPHALHLHERHHHPHASVLPTPSGNVAVLGPSVDELRHLLATCRTALTRGVYEPCWCGACGGRTLMWPPAADVGVWRELLQAAEQLISVVSTLQDVLCYASPRLLHPSTAISSSLASFGATASAVIGLTINSTAQLAEVLLMPHGAPPQLLAHRASLASASWAAARAELQDSRAAAVQHYWTSISSHSGKLVAASSEALAVMFVWVAVGGVMTAVERLDVAGSRLIISSSPQLAGVDAAAGTKSSSAAELSRGSLLFNRRPSKLGLEAHHMQQQHHHHHHPHTQSLAAVMHRVLGTTTTTSSRGAVSKGQPQLPLHHEPHHQHHRQEQVSQWLQAAQNVVSALLLLPLLKNIAGFWHLQLRQLSSVFVGCCCSRGCSHSTPTPVKTDDGVTRRSPSPQSQSSCLYRLRHNRSAAAALKLWLGMSGLVVLFILVAENPSGRIHPTVSYAVMTVPTHGVIALVLAWHERVESTFIRVFLRIAGTAAGGTVGWAALQATTNPVLLLLIMCCVGVLIAPLASASFHFRLATALTIISMLVVVLCQFDAESGESKATNTFYGTRLVEVTIACLWAAFFNKLLLPWSSKDWSLEQISAALVAAARVLNNSYQLQFKAALAITAAAAAGVEAAEAPGGGSRSGSSSSGGADNTSSSKAQLAAALVAQEAALQKGLVEPVVGVQTALTLETHVWFQRSAPRTVPRALKQLVRDMLQLADRITAVQVAVAALPDHTTTAAAGGGAGGGGRGPHAAHNGQGSSNNTAASTQQQQQQAVEQSIRYVITVLTQPLHECHQHQLQLVVSLAAAVKALLLSEPPAADAADGFTHKAHLQLLISQLEFEQERSSTLLARLRKQLHHDVIHSPPVQLQQQQQQHPPQADSDPYSNSDNSHQQQQPPQQPPTTELEQRLVRAVSTAMSSDGVLPVLHPDVRAGAGVGAGDVGGAGDGSNNNRAADLAVHVSRWWWVHAGEHYTQLLAFEYAFGASVAGVLAVARTALHV